MLGKRHRPPMKRTTSMSEITFDLNTITDDVDPNNPLSRQGPGGGGGGGVGVVPYAPPAAGFNGSDQSRVLATVSPRNNHTRHFSTDSAHTPHFLRACFLCKRRLVPGRDIYMYRFVIVGTLLFIHTSGVNFNFTDVFCISQCQY